MSRWRAQGVLNRCTHNGHPWQKQQQRRWQGFLGGVESDAGDAVRDTGRPTEDGGSGGGETVAAAALAFLPHVTGRMTWSRLMRMRHL